MLTRVSLPAPHRGHVRQRAARRGFALMIVLMTITVLLIGATVIYSNITSAQDVIRVSRAQQVLLRLVNEFGKSGQNPSFQGDVGKYPHRISHLVVPITTSDSNDCGDAYTGGGGGEVTRWTGPYHLIPTRSDGIYTVGTGFIAEDTLHREPARASNGSDPGTLYIVMKNVALTDAQALDFSVDGVTTGAGPTVKFTPNGDNPVTVYYGKAIVGC